MTSTSLFCSHPLRTPTHAQGTATNIPFQRPHRRNAVSYSGAAFPDEDGHGVMSMPSSNDLMSTYAAMDVVTTYDPVRSDVMLDMQLHIDVFFDSKC